MPVRLTLDDPEHDIWVVNGRTDGNPVVRDGDTFEVEDQRAMFLLSLYFPRLKPAPGA